MVQRPCPDLRGGCAAMRIPTVTGGEGLGNDPSYPAAQLSSHRIGQVFILHAGGRPPTRDEGANALPGVEVMTADATTPTVNGMMYADFFDFT